jgi:vitamin B12/bleomycin/antimicrobial peptide transport system ATP-binding/permease protein
MRPNNQVAAGGSSALDVGSAGVTPREALLSVLDSSTDATDEPTLSMKTRACRFLIKRFWATAAGFWGRRGSRAAWTLSAAVLAIILFNLGMLYAINPWNRKKAARA